MNQRMMELIETASYGYHIYFLDPDGLTYDRFPTKNIENLTLHDMKSHTNLLVLQEDVHSCRNYVVEMMYILKNKFKELGKDRFNETICKIIFMKAL